MSQQASFCQNPVWVNTLAATFWISQDNSCCCFHRGESVQCNMRAFLPAGICLGESRRAIGLSCNIYLETVHFSWFHQLKLPSLSFVHSFFFSLRFILFIRESTRSGKGQRRGREEHEQTLCWAWNRTQAPSHDPQIAPELKPRVGHSTDCASRALRLIP